MPDEAHVTVRIPELPGAGDLTPADKIAIWQADTNITSMTALSTVMAFMGTGGNGTPAQPVVNGSHLIHDVTPAEDGGTIVSLPTIAGESFYLERDGRALIEGTDFDILAAGGFQLTIPNDVLIEGQRFSLNVYTLQGGGGVPGSTGVGGGGSLVDGVVNVSTNLNMTAANHLNKLIQVRAGTNSITITLPDLSDIPENTIIPFESSINNTYQTKIATQGGQYIYFKNGSFNNMYIGPNEALWLFRDSTGFYVIMASGNFRDVGKVQAAYAIEDGELLADGSLKLRSQYPRLWEWCQGLSGSLVSDTTWLTSSVTVAGRTVPNPYRGCYSTGDGSTTFRVPNLMNVALRGLKTASGTDSERHTNNPGGFQLDEVISHTHGYSKNNSASNSDSGGTPDFVTQAASTTGAYGGTETRMMNTGILWTIKA